MSRVAVAYPLVQGVGMYRECLTAILKHARVIEPKQHELANWLGRNFGASNAEFRTRGPNFLATLELLETFKLDGDKAFRLGSPGRRYLQTEEPDVLFYQFSRHVKRFDRMIKAFNEAAQTVSDLEEVVGYDRTNIWQRVHWLETLEAIETTGEYNNEYTLTEAGKDMAAVFVGS